MKYVKVKDASFKNSHALGFGGDNTETPQLMRWDRTPSTAEDTVVFVDAHLRNHKKVPAGRRIALLNEPPAIQPGMYAWIMEHCREFDMVLTYMRSLVERGDPFVFYPRGGCWIHDNDWRLMSKPLNCSILVSQKVGQQGHQLRHKAATLAGVDAFGRGVDNWIPSKTTALLPYRFSIVIENSRAESYFTEKLIDAFATWTVPIYWGCPDIHRFFHSAGMITFNNFEELAHIVSRLTEREYWRMFDALDSNRRLAENYRCAEDWIMTNAPEVFQ